jgi:DNA modification methylase
VADPPNLLYYGDNLDVLRRHVEDESVDLVYLDPPFNSNASYNVLFAEKDGTQAASQIKAFEDTWEWNEDAARAFEQIVEAGGQTSQAMQAFRTLLGDSDMMAYLAMMAPRLAELRRVLKPTGSLYLHCDPTASHYLKLLLDAVFGPINFRNEIIWKRTTAHSSAKKFAPIHDVLLYYARADKPAWNGPRVEYEQEYLEKYYKYDDGDGRLYWRNSLTAAGVRHGSSGKVWRGIDVSATGQHWKFTVETLDALDAKGQIYWPPGGKGFPQIKRYRDELKGVAVGDIWTDIDRINQVAAERLGYPTQKPEALLERIISASSNEGDLVLDPFCGCGTTVAAAQKLKRRWIGIDITNLAITLIRGRLADTFAGTVKYEVIGEPVSMPDATKLAHDDPYQFQWWALGLVGARPVEEKKGADKGIDGRIYFHVGDAHTRQIILSVKAGKLHATYVRDLRGVVDREKADMGVLISLEEPTGLMRKEAASAGFYTSPWGKHARLQLITVEDLLTGKNIDRPPLQTSVTFKRAPKATAPRPERKRLEFEKPDDDQPF